ncbi:hypothetical protein [Eggerthella sp. YY7918]|uniref:hypothetical protein n=1 Tax=Eggerthella sp. (strain YY7918) TaxID=502558 RepID=UPI00021716C0|nr:hypothetical protein [Eggerthella sp. YY7918]BAK45551.1 hypothetical protein EGYY_24820 [Eggerthella sp. YY7918]
MNEKDLIMFKRKAMRSKAELIKAIGDYLNRAKERRSGDQVAESLELMEKFEEKIEKSPLPFLEKPFSAYEVTITDIDIILNIVEYEDIVFNQEAEMEEATASVSSDIVHVRAPYISVDEFAIRRNVKLKTVYTWLQDGRLRNAEKRKSGWYIAATQRPPTRRFISGTYIYEKAEGDLSSLEIFPKGTVYVEVHHDTCPLNHITSYLDKDFGLIRQSRVNDKERVEIEKALIGSSNVIFRDTLVNLLLEKTWLEAREYKEFVSVSARVEKFISSAVLPLETKQLLKIMLFSEGDEELFLSTVRKLKLEDLLHRYLHDSK